MSLSVQALGYRKWAITTPHSILETEYGLIDGENAWQYGPIPSNGAGHDEINHDVATNPGNWVNSQGDGEALDLFGRGNQLPLPLPLRNSGILVRTATIAALRLRPMWIKAPMMSAMPSIPAEKWTSLEVRVGSMLSKKSQTASRLISRRKTKHATIARRYALRPIAEVTGEFIAL